MTHTDKLLNEFPPVSREAWEEAIRADLNGADYERALIWRTPEKMAVKPYYLAEDIAECLRHDEDQGSRYASQPLACMKGNWRIREEVDAADPEEANRVAREAVASGVEEIAFRSRALHSSSDLQNLCAGLNPIPLRFEDATESLLNLLLAASENLAHSSISVGWNPLSAPEFAAAALRRVPPGFVPFTICSEQLQERGASAVEEIAYALAGGIEFLREMQACKIDIDRAASSIVFSFSVGASYIFQIAKFRAFRSLWAKVVSCFAADCGNANARVYARTSRWNKTICDPHVNILRATTEVMSAALGGVDSICVAPFDECFKAPDAASRRLARNTQLILKLEAMLGRVADPAAGSYCIEAITDFLACESWKYMQTIEASGGYTASCKSGQLDKSLRDFEVRQEEAVISLRRVLTGTNKYADATERLLDRMEPQQEPDARRGAVAYENLRLRTERYAAETGRTPHILLAEIGDSKVRLARSRFAANFLACAGFGVEAKRFNTANQIEEADADLIVLCSSDEEYSDIVLDLVARMKDAGRHVPLIIAGNPESADRLRAAGIAGFIHSRTNPVDMLTKMQQWLGIMV